MEYDINGKYPGELYRGVTSNNFLTEDGFITAAAFNFPKSSDRVDHFCELSVNWNDDSGSLENLSKRHKKGDTERQFKAGYCVINRSHVKLLMMQYNTQDICRFKYERSPEEASEDNDYQENKYHGNLLIWDEVDKNIKKNIEFTLAALAKFHEWDVDEKNGTI